MDAKIWKCFVLITTALPLPKPCFWPFYSAPWILSSCPFSITISTLLISCLTFYATKSSDLFLHPFIWQLSDWRHTSYRQGPPHLSYWGSTRNLLQPINGMTNHTSPALAGLMPLIYPDIYQEQYHVLCHYHLKWSSVFLPEHQHRPHLSQSSSSSIPDLPPQTGMQTATSLLAAAACSTPSHCAS